MKKLIEKTALLLAFIMIASLYSCERLDNDPDQHIADRNPEYVGLNELVEILTLLPISQQQLDEVHSAVCSSSENGYDEEYMMSNMFKAPGSGVGDKAMKSGDVYDTPMRNLISDVVMDLSNQSSRTRSEHRNLNVLQTLDRIGPDAFLDALERSDMQIYWPFSENWDGNQMPIMTYDPEDGSESNIGYRLVVDDDGFRYVEDVLVDEELAKRSPVWVINRNDDAAYTSLEMLRREDPDWGEGGGNIIVRPGKSQKARVSEKSCLRTLLLRDFTMKRHYDTWFAGASEFFVKLGSVEDFTASTEAELRLYSPSVTDFMIVVRRNQLGRPQAFNAVLVSEFTDQLTHCAFMITEDDGGTVSKWDCTAFVRVESKSYGIEVSLPFNSRDDIVWRGQLSSTWFENNDNVTGHFGDVDLTFELLEN